MTVVCNTPVYKIIVGVLQIDEDFYQHGKNCLHMLHVVHRVPEWLRLEGNLKII